MKLAVLYQSVFSETSPENSRESGRFFFHEFILENPAKFDFFHDVPEVLLFDGFRALHSGLKKIAVQLINKQCLDVFLLDWLRTSLHYHRRALLYAMAWVAYES